MIKRKSISVFIICLITFFSCNYNAESQVPKAVKKAFKMKYPGMKIIDWEKDSNGNYEYKFKDKGVKYRADFTPNGEWVETETNISFKELPKPIRGAIKKNYGNRDISEIEKVDSALKGEFYDVEFEQPGKNMDIEYRASGDEL